MERWEAEREQTELKYYRGLEAERGMREKHLLDNIAAVKEELRAANRHVVDIHSTHKLKAAEGQVQMLSEQLKDSQTLVHKLSEDMELLRNETRS